MSKLFDILNRSDGEIADLVRPLADAAEGAAPQAVAPAGGTAQAPAGTALNGAAAVLGQVRKVTLRVPAPSPLLPFEDAHQRPSEQYRMLRTKLSQHPKQPRVIVISSPTAGDGKSVSAINIAAALSLKSEAQVLLVDADLRKSAIHVDLGLPASPGLSEVLKGACTFEEALVHTQEFPNLFVLTAGTPPENPVELLDSPQWESMFQKLRGLFRYVVLDSPPVGAVADYDLIQAVSDGVALVMRPDHTRRELCKKALESVPKGKLLGVVLNCVPDWSLARHGGSDYYYYSGAYAYRAAKP